MREDKQGDPNNYRVQSDEQMQSVPIKRKDSKPNDIGCSN